MRNNIALLLLLLSACETSIGSVQVFIEAEDTIPEGLQPGSGEEQVVDGWSVRYDKFLVVVGDFTAERSDNANDVLTVPGARVVDLLNLPAGGRARPIQRGRGGALDQVAYSLPDADADTKAAEGTDDADHALDGQGRLLALLRGRDQQARRRVLRCRSGHLHACA